MVAVSCVAVRYQHTEICEISIQDVANGGDVFMVPKGTTIMGVSYDESGIFSFMIKGKPGLWYSARQFFRD